MRSKDFAKASGKLVGTSMRSKDLAKASGLDLRQPQGALAEGQCGLGREGYNRTGLEEGHSRQAKTRLVIVQVLSYICRLKPIYHECCHCHQWH